MAPPHPYCLNVISGRISNVACHLFRLLEAVQEDDRAEAHAKKNFVKIPSANQLDNQNKSAIKKDQGERGLKPHQKSNLCGILNDLPTNADLRSTAQDTMQFTGEMARQIRMESKEHHMKRDKHSEYVEARARFQKLHNVS